MSLIGVLLVLGTAQFASAEVKLCSDLYRFTCADAGTVNDGTGASTKMSFLGSIQAQEAAARAVESNLSSAITNPGFRKTALSATGLVVSPDCESDNKDRQKACSETLVKAVGTKVLQTLFTSSSAYASDGADQVLAKDLNFLVDSNEFQRALSTALEVYKKFPDNKDTVSKIEEAFPKVQDLLLAKVDKYVTPEKRGLLREKIKSITWEGSTCDKPKSPGVPLTPTLMSAMHYDGQKNSFQICSGMLQRNLSEFEIVHQIARELAKSIDPCGIAHGPSDFTFKYENKNARRAEREYPIQNLIQCLRRPNSVAATRPRNRSPLGQVGYGYGAGFLGQFYGGTSDEVGDVGPSEGPGGIGNFEQEPMTGGAMLGGADQHFCPTPRANDPVSDAVSIWLASEILPDYMKNSHPDLTAEQRRLGYSNVWRSSCNEFGGSNISIKNRVNGILLVQPEIRKQMECTTEKVSQTYCDPLSPTRSEEEQEEKEQREDKLRDMNDHRRGIDMDRLREKSKSLHPNALEGDQ